MTGCTRLSSTRATYWSGSALRISILLPACIWCFWRSFTSARLHHREQASKTVATIEQAAEAFRQVQPYMVSRCHSEKRSSQKMQGMPATLRTCALWLPGLQCCTRRSSSLGDIKLSYHATAQMKAGTPGWEST